MDFADRIRELIALLEKNKDHVFSEEATKNSMVMPFLQVLGYNIFDPTEVVPEFADAVGVKKAEKIDYAIKVHSVPTILIEVKSARSRLQAQHHDQLLRYFFTHTMSPSESRYGVLTNGIEYQFFSDFDNKNQMDAHPFLTVHLTPSIRATEIEELRKFHKEYFKPDEMRSTAKDLKYTGEIKRAFKQQLKEPEEDFVKFFIKKIGFPGMATKQVIDKFSPIVQSAFRQYVNEVVSDTLESALKEAKKAETGEVEEERTKDILRKRFWTQLLGYAKTKTDLHAKLSPTPGGWVGAGAGVSGFGYCYSITKHDGTVQLYIDRGKDKEAENERIFDRLAAAKSDIEQAFGGPLEWERLEGKRACRLKKAISGGGYLDEQAWPKVQEDMVENMIKLEEALAPQIRKLKAELG